MFNSKNALSPVTIMSTSEFIADANIGKSSLSRISGYSSFFISKGV